MTVLASKLPKALQGQVKNIQPYLISNQVVPAPAANVDATIHLVASAQDNGKDVTLVCTRDNAGIWSFAEVQPPDGMTVYYYVINSSGVIAGINDQSHAVLLVPIDIEPDSAYTGGSGTNQTNAIDTQDITPDDGNEGDIVPSIYASAPIMNPQKHYVSPKSTSASPGDFLAFKSGLLASMASQFEWVTDNAGQTILPDSKDATSDVLVKRNLAARTRIQLRVKGTTNPVDTMNVWVVWATGEITQKPDLAFSHTIGDTTIDNTPTTSALITGNKPWHFVFTIDPKEITNLHSDIPNLLDNNHSDPPVPGGSMISPSPGGTSLAGGVDRQWDVSRRYSFVISNPASIPNGKFLSGFGTIYSMAIPNGIVVPLPNDPLIGNDDFGNTSTENNDPYDIEEYSDLNHSIGQLSAFDIPELDMPDVAGSNGNTLEQYFLAQEFVRLQIGKAWYIISDPLLWKVVEKLKFSNGKWQDMVLC